MGLAGCAHHPPPPGPGTSQGVPPDLHGRRVMVLPVQRSVAIEGDLDAELAFALQERGQGVHWVLPAELDKALERSPGLDTRTRGLPVDVFLAAEVHRIGDPLFGYLRRLGALADADFAVLPVQAALMPDSSGGGAIRVWATVLDVRSGWVLWFGIVQGESGPAEDPKPLASAADKLARALLGPATSFQ